MDAVRSNENVLPASYLVSLIDCVRGGLTLTPLARTGQPANSPTERRTNENTCDVEGNLDARTTEADNALVSERDEVRLFVSSYQAKRGKGTYDFSSTGVSY